VCQASVGCFESHYWSDLLLPVCQLFFIILLRIVFFSLTPYCLRYFSLSCNISYLISIFRHVSIW
jgi:hypothetical protein